MEECTFKPKINEINVQDMPMAQQYTSYNAFERLSKPLEELIQEENNEKSGLDTV